MVSTTAQMRWHGQHFRTFLSAKIAGAPAVEIVVYFIARNGKWQKESITNTRKTYANYQTSQRSRITSPSFSRDNGETWVEQAELRPSWRLGRGWWTKTRSRT